MITKLILVALSFLSGPPVCHEDFTCDTFHELFPWQEPNLYVSGPTYQNDHLCIYYPLAGVWLITRNASECIDAETCCIDPKAPVGDLSFWYGDMDGDRDADLYDYALYQRAFALRFAQ